MNFSNLVKTTTRSEDSYINATAWCREFGTEWYEFTRLPETKRYLKALENSKTGKIPYLKSVAGRYGGTWVHPLVAIQLAKWLSPEFAVFVNQVFKRYIEGDITLADDILQRAPIKDAEWLRDRADGVVARLEFTAELQERGCSRLGYAKNTNAVYVGLMGQTAATLKETLAVKNPRDGMSKSQLRAIALVESLAVDRFHETKAFGDKQTTECTLKVSRAIGEAIDSL